VSKTDDVRETIVALVSLLNCPFISASTRQQLESLKAELEAELRFSPAQQSDVAKAS
jgi:hypothetical protein